MPTLILQEWLPAFSHHAGEARLCMFTALIPYNIPMTDLIVFQLRVVTGTPSSLSSMPR